MKPQVMFPVCTIVKNVLTLEIILTRYGKSESYNNRYPAALSNVDQEDMINNTFLANK